MKPKRIEIMGYKQHLLLVDSVPESLILSLTDYHKMRGCPDDPLRADFWKLNSFLPRYIDVIETDDELFVTTTSLINAAYCSKDTWHWDLSDDPEPQLKVSTYLFE
ncbi:MAG: hypothetical protein JEY79_07265 [Pseudodesulfovibrio sp.]|nr:hypothetical protein [Pseudodesulfovibrio sp.]